MRAWACPYLRAWACGWRYDGAWPSCVVLPAKNQLLHQQILRHVVAREACPDARSISDMVALWSFGYQARALGTTMREWGLSFVRALGTTTRE